MAAAERAAVAGVDRIELYGVHGYLINQFMSPLTNERMDGYGGSLKHRYLIASIFPQTGFLTRNRTSLSGQAIKYPTPPR